MDHPAGDDWIALTEAALPQAAIGAWVVRPDCGAVVVFVGTVRDHADGRTGVHLLEYEAYEEQVVPRLAEVAATARARWGDLGRIALLHRVGPLALGEASVLVAVSTPHRAAAFAAAEWCIDTIKATLPVWKREHHDAGTDWGTCATEVAEVAEVDAGQADGRGVPSAEPAR